MKSKFLIFVMACLAVLSLSVHSFAVNISEEEISPRKKIYLEPPKTILEKANYKFLLGGSAGYDSNTHLDSQRDGDAYMQTFFRGAFSSPLSEKTKGLFDYEFMNLMYSSEPTLDLIRNGIRLGTDYKISDKWSFLTNYRFDSIEYLGTGIDDYLDNSIEFKVKNNLPMNMFHSLGYDFLWRTFAKRYTRVTATTYSDKERNDLRSTVNYEIGKYFTKDLFKINFEYFNNNSNETYLKYYDYDSYKVGSSFTHIFTDKVTGMCSFSRRLRKYRSRTLINDAGAYEWEKTYEGSTALFYSLNKSLSFGLNYTYRQNNSNEPIDSYSGSLISLSSYYRF